jgi:CPA2 family monovalent cation:H+ antiporter-2
LSKRFRFFRSPKRTESLRQNLFAPFFEDGQGYRTLVQLRSADQQFDLRWVLLKKGSPLVTRSIVGVEIRKKSGASVVGVIRNEKLIANADATFRFQAGDLVAIMGTEEARKSIQEMIAPLLTADKAPFFSKHI